MEVKEKPPTIYVPLGYTKVPVPGGWMFVPVFDRLGAERWN